MSCNCSNFATKEEELKYAFKNGFKIQERTSEAKQWEDYKGEGEFCTDKFYQILYPIRLEKGNQIKCELDTLNIREFLTLDNVEYVIFEEDSDKQKDILQYARFYNEFKTEIVDSLAQEGFLDVYPLKLQIEKESTEQEFSIRSDLNLTVTSSDTSICEIDLETNTITTKDKVGVSTIFVKAEKEGYKPLQEVMIVQVIEKQQIVNNNFDANGGVSTDDTKIDPIFVPRHKLLTLPECTFTYIDDTKEFSHWSIDPKDGSHFKGTAGTKIPCRYLDDNTIWYAIWKDKPQLPRTQLVLTPSDSPLSIVINKSKEIEVITNTPDNTFEVESDNIEFVQVEKVQDTNNKVTIKAVKAGDATVSFKAHKEGYEEIIRKIVVKAVEVQTKETLLNMTNKDTSQEGKIIYTFETDAKELTAECQDGKFTPVVDNDKKTVTIELGTTYDTDTLVVKATRDATEFIVYSEKQYTDQFTNTQPETTLILTSDFPQDLTDITGDVTLTFETPASTISYDFTEGEDKVTVEQNEKTLVLKEFKEGKFVINIKATEDGKAEKVLTYTRNVTVAPETQLETQDTIPADLKTTQQPVTLNFTTNADTISARLTKNETLVQVAVQDKAVTLSNFQVGETRLEVTAQAVGQKAKVWGYDLTITAP